MTSPISFQAFVRDNKFRTAEQVEAEGRRKFAELFFGNAKPVLLLRHLCDISWIRTHEEFVTLLVKSGLATNTLEAEALIPKLATGEFTEGHLRSTLFRLEVVKDGKGTTAYRMTVGAPDVPDGC